MSLVTGFTAARLLIMEAATIVSGAIVGDNLILTKNGGGTVNAGNVRGPQGIPGPTGTNLITNAMLNNALGEPGAASVTSGWTPAVTIAGTPITYGTGSSRQGQYIRQGKKCLAIGNVVLGSAPAFGAGGTFEFSLPVTPAANPTMFAIGVMRISGLTGSVVAYFPGVLISGSTFSVRYPSTYPSSATETRVSSTAPAVPIAASRYEFSVIYETT